MAGEDYIDVAYVKKILYKPFTVPTDFTNCSITIIECIYSALSQRMELKSYLSKFNIMASALFMLIFFVHLQCIHINALIVQLWNGHISTIVVLHIPLWSLSIVMELAICYRNIY